MATLNELLANPKRQIIIKQRQVAMEFGLELERLLARSKLKRVELARRLGKSRAWVSKMLNGPRNLKLFTAVEVADALDCDVELRLVPRQAEMRMSLPTVEFVTQVHAEAQAMGRFGIAVAPPDICVTAQGTVCTPSAIAA